MIRNHAEQESGWLEMAYFYLYLVLTNSFEVPMKCIKFLLSLLLTLSIFYGLNTKFGITPPLGRFLDPFHGFWKMNILYFVGIVYSE